MRSRCIPPSTPAFAPSVCVFLVRLPRAAPPPPHPPAVAVPPGRHPAGWRAGFEDAGAAWRPPRRAALPPRAFSPAAPPVWLRTTAWCGAPCEGLPHLCFRGRPAVTTNLCCHNPFPVSHRRGLRVPCRCLACLPDGTPWCLGGLPPAALCRGLLYRSCVPGQPCVPSRVAAYWSAPRTDVYSALVPLTFLRTLRAAF